MQSMRLLKCHNELRHFLYLAMVDWLLTHTKLLGFQQDVLQDVTKREI